MSNVKAGDLAIVIAPYRHQPDIGRPVQVVRAGVYGEQVFTRKGGVSMCVGDGGPGWLCDAHGQEFPRFIADQYLRPIRGSEGQDETLAWQPVPAKEVA